MRPCASGCAGACEFLHVGVRNSVCAVVCVRVRLHVSVWVLLCAHARGGGACASACACVCGCVYGGVWVCARSFECVCICVRTRCVRVRVRVSVHACLRERACACVRAFPSDCIFARGCVVKACARRGAAWALPSHLRGRAVLIGRPATRGRPPVFAFDAIGRHLRVGRRCDVDTRDRQRAVGCALLAHDRDRRRRRHLCPRRQRRLRLLQRRLGEHRRRCAAGLAHGGGSKGYWDGSQGYSAVLRKYYKDTTLVLQE